MRQSEISSGVREVLCDYLNMHNLNPKAAMDNETTNNEVVAIVHAGLPTMIRKIYSLERMKTFFWAREDLMMESTNMHLTADDKKGKNWFERWAGGDRSLEYRLLLSRKLCQG